MSRRKGAMYMGIPRSSAAIMIPATVMLLPMSIIPTDVRSQSCTNSLLSTVKIPSGLAVYNELHRDHGEMHVHQAVDRPVFLLSDFNMI